MIYVHVRMQCPAGDSLMSDTPLTAWHLIVAEMGITACQPICVIVVLSWQFESLNSWVSFLRKLYLITSSEFKLIIELLTYTMLKHLATGLDRGLSYLLFAFNALRCLPGLCSNWKATGFLDGGFCSVLHNQCNYRCSSYINVTCFGCEG